MLRPVSNPYPALVSMVIGGQFEQFWLGFDSINTRLTEPDYWHYQTSMVCIAGLILAWHGSVQ